MIHPKNIAHKPTSGSNQKELHPFIELMLRNELDKHFFRLKGYHKQQNAEGCRHQLGHIQKLLERVHKDTLLEEAIYLRYRVKWWWYEIIVQRL